MSNATAEPVGAMLPCQFSLVPQLLLAPRPVHVKVVVGVVRSSSNSTANGPYSFRSDVRRPRVRGYMRDSQRRHVLDFMVCRFRVVPWVARIKQPVAGSKQTQVQSCGALGNDELNAPEYPRKRTP